MMTFTTLCEYDAISDFRFVETTKNAYIRNFFVTALFLNGLNSVRSSQFCRPNRGQFPGVHYPFGMTMNCSD